MTNKPLVEAPLEVLTFAFIKLNKYLLIPTVQNEEESISALELVRKFERGEGDLECLERIQTELGENYSEYLTCSIKGRERK